MCLMSNTLTELLNEINDELANQISLANKMDKKIDTRKLVQLSNTPNGVIRTSGLSDENKSMLQKFSLTLEDNSTVKSLRYEKQDLERVISNLKDN